MRSQASSCTLTTDRPIAFDPYPDNRDMGGFVLIDRLSNDTVAAEMAAELIVAALRQRGIVSAP